MQARAAEIAAETGGFQTDQFNNTDMIDGYLALGQELFDQVDGRLDAIGMYVGTAGCFLGTTRALRERLPEVHRVAVEPAESAVLSGGRPGTHRIEGGGVGFVPPLPDARRRSTRSSRSRRPTRSRWRAGPPARTGSGRDPRPARTSRGARLARRLGEGARVATIQVDSGFKYLAGELYS